MILRRELVIALALAAAGSAACDTAGYGPPSRDLRIASAGGQAQTDTVGQALPVAYAVLVTDGPTVPAPGLEVPWAVVSGGGTIAAGSNVTDESGRAQAVHTLGPAAGPQTVRASVAGAAGSPITFTATAVPAAPSQLLKTQGDGQSGAAGQPLSLNYTVRSFDQYGNPTPGVGVEWTVLSGGGTLSASSTSTDPAGGASVRHTLGSTQGPQSVRAGLAVAPSVSVTFMSTAATQPILVAEVPIPPNYGIHDTYVRDGLAFVSAWNTGIMIYDVGNGIKGGSPAAPRLVSSLVTAGGSVHNAWWFHNPNSNEKRYLFIGQEGPASIGSSSSGDLHVVDVSDLNHPVEVAFFHIGGAGPHNFWMDESAQILYSAYYNAGVLALDVSGTLSGNLSARGIDTLAPGGGGNTFVWGVQLHNGSLYAVDMLSGFWQLSPAPTLSVRAGGNNVPDRFGSDLWVHGTYAYTGTWSQRGANLGNAVKVWELGQTGAPTLVDSVIVTGIRTVSDVEVSADGKLLMFSAEGGTAPGLYIYSLANPARPTAIANYVVANNTNGLHTATFGTINGRLYVFTARDPTNPSLMIFDVTHLIP